jgi:hypothetical protein
VVVASKFLDIWYPLDAREALGSWFLKWTADQRKKKSLLFESKKKKQLCTHLLIYEFMKIFIFRRALVGFFFF